MIHPNLGDLIHVSNLPQVSNNKFVSLFTFQNAIQVDKKDEQGAGFARTDEESRTGSVGWMQTENYG